MKNKKFTAYITAIHVGLLSTFTLHGEEQINISAIYSGFISQYYTSAFDLRKYDLDVETLVVVKNRISTNDIGRFGSQFDSRVVGKGAVLQGFSMGSGTLQSSVYIIRNLNELVYLPLTDINNNAIAMMVPGLEDFFVRTKIEMENKIFTPMIRKSEKYGTFEVVNNWPYPLARAVPSPDNEETAELRGTVGVGIPIEVATRRLAEFEKGVLAHPPEDSAWTQFWKVGEGLLALEMNKDAATVRKLAYILWPEQEDFVTIELSRIYLIDGEMVMPIPPPPPWTEQRQQELKQQEETLRLAMIQHNQQQRLRNQNLTQAEVLEIKARGEGFLAENAGRENVTVTASGLQYQVIEAGEGAKPAATDIVTVHYIGRFIDGTVFDSSRQRGEPAHLPLDRVIPGWAEGVQLMSPGAKYRFWIPSHLAYGPNAPPFIGPNQVLDFEVELIEIK